MKNLSKIILVAALAATFWMSKGVAGQEYSGGTCGWNGYDSQCEGSCNGGIPPAKGYSWSCIGWDQSSCGCWQTQN